MNFRRSSRVVRRIGSMLLMRNGSMIVLMAILFCLRLSHGMRGFDGMIISKFRLGLGFSDPGRTMQGACQPENQCAALRRVLNRHAYRPGRRACVTGSAGLVGVAHDGADEVVLGEDVEVAVAPFDKHRGALLAEDAGELLDGRVGGNA